jgi:hypothetical protein
MSATLSVEEGRMLPLPSRLTSGTAVFVIATSVASQSSIPPRLLQNCHKNNLMC